MADFNIRSDSVDVEQIMEQIRARIREKRGVDYTEEQVRELATVRLEKFLDPKNLRSDLLDQFRRSRPALPEPPQEPPPVEPPYAIDDETLVTSHRAVLRGIRKLLQPILKLFFNPNRLTQVLQTQAQFNVDMIKRDQRRKIEMLQQMQSFDRSRAEWNVLYYEVLHNLVLETTRNAIELKNLRMRVEALASRVDFSERRVRALEGVVQYRPEAVRPRERLRHPDDEHGATDIQDASAAPTGEGAPPHSTASMTPVEARRKRRRRRGRRAGTLPGGVGADAMSAGQPRLPGDELETDDEERDTTPAAGEARDSAGPDANDPPRGDADPPTDRDPQ